MRTRFTLLAASLVFFGAGCVPGPEPVEPKLLPPPPQPSAEPSAALPPSTEGVAYEGWSTITPGGIAEFHIPPGCNAEGAAGTTYIVCPTPDNPTPIPEFTISSDGRQLNVRRWEDLESPYWDDVIASMRIQTPLKSDVQINIQK